MVKKVIIWTNPELGNVCVCTPAPEFSCEEVKDRSTPNGITSYIVETSELPEEDGDFFNAWEQANGVVTVNLDKAKALTKDRLRAERAPLLAAQDVAFQRALESGADTTAIVAEKQRLRDITILTDACTNTAELRALKVS